VLSTQSGLHISENICLAVDRPFSFELGERLVTVWGAFSIKIVFAEIGVLGVDHLGVVDSHQGDILMEGLFRYVLSRS
jgi:hypothetical protein